MRIQEFSNDILWSSWCSIRRVSCTKRWGDRHRCDAGVMLVSSNLNVHRRTGPRLLLPGDEHAVVCSGIAESRYQVGWMGCWLLVETHGGYGAACWCVAESCRIHVLYLYQAVRYTITHTPSCFKRHVDRVLHVDSVDVMQLSCQTLRDEGCKSSLQVPYLR